MGGDREEGAAERSGGPRPHGLRLADLLTVGGESDESGRLLLEDSAPVTARRRARRAGIEMDTVTYAHRDSPSRTGGRMNRSAYEALRRDTAAIFDGFAWLRARTLRTGAVEEGTVALLTTLSKLGITLPLVAFHRVRDPVPRHGALPTFAASIFKAGRGLYSATVDMAGRQGAGARPTAAEVLAFAEEHGHLRRPATGRVCAAPSRLIERTIAVLLTGAGADPDRSALPDVVDFDMLWRFHALERRFGEALGRYAAVLQRVLRAGGAPDPTLLFDVPVGDGTTFGALTESFLAEVNAVQSELNRLLGRRDDARPFTFEDALGAL